MSDENINEEINRPDFPRDRVVRNYKLKRSDKRMSSKSGSGCFIATACYGDYNSPEVLILRKFRDEILENNYFGRIFIKFYYASSPRIARYIQRKKSLKKYIKQYLIEPLVNFIKNYC